MRGVPSSTWMMPQLGKAVFFQQVLHDLVVGVGVGPQALAVLQTPGDHSGGNAGVPARRSQPVDGAVGQGIVQPLAILDPGHRWGPGQG